MRENIFKNVETVNKSKLVCFMSSCHGLSVVGSAHFKGASECRRHYMDHMDLQSITSCSTECLLKRKLEFSAQT